MTVIATERLVHESLQAAEEAERDGISVEVVDPRTPRSRSTRRRCSSPSVKKTNRAVVAHGDDHADGWASAAEVAARPPVPGVRLARRAPIERVGAKFSPLPFAPVMENFVVPHADDVLAAIKRTVGKK